MNDAQRSEIAARIAAYHTGSNFRKILEKSGRDGRDPVKLEHGRHLARWLLKQGTRLTFKEVGALIGGVDHSTAGNSIRRVENSRKLRMLADECLREFRIKQEQMRVPESAVLGATLAEFASEGDTQAIAVLRRCRNLIAKRARRGAA